MITVFVLDDHEMVRRGLVDILTEAGGIEVIGEAGTASAALRRIPALRPTVAVLDARLPDGSGIEVCRQVQSADPSIRCIILTSYDDNAALNAAVLAGAYGYVLKDVRNNDLVEGIRKVAAGQSLLDPEQVDKAREELSADHEDERLARLTPQERRILSLIAKGMSNRQIGEELFLAEKTVKNYVSSLLAKLSMERRTQAAVFAAKLRDR